MGKKLSKISCVGGQDAQDGQGRRKRSKRCRSKIRRRNGDRQTQDLIFVDRSGSSASRVATDRSPDLQGSGVQSEKLIIGSLTNLPEVVIMPTREVEKLETIAECNESSAKCKIDRLEVPQNKQVGQLIQDTSKKIGNSIELLPCPDMSTISMFTDPSCVKGARGIAAGATGPKLQTPNGVTTVDEFTNVTPLGNEPFSILENTHSTLTVPPNSINSQFISGITPLDSLQDAENPPDTTRDSVFAHDLSYIPEHCLDAVFYANYGAGRMLLNNKSLVASPEYASLKSGKHSARAGSSIEASDGPGLDSDFGASAGVEMRIVSSDFSDANNNAASAVIERGHVTVDVASLGKATIRDPDTGRKRASASDAMDARGAKKLKRTETFLTRTLPVVEMGQAVGSSRCLAYGLVLRDPNENRRPATVGRPEGLFHVTMEWDPYDTHYGDWREYFIPGVSYPPRPVLCPVEYWI